MLVCMHLNGRIVCWSVMGGYKKPRSKLIIHKKIKHTNDFKRDKGTFWCRWFNEYPIGVWDNIQIRCTMTHNGGLVDRKGWRRKLVVARQSKSWGMNVQPSCKFANSPIRCSIPISISLVDIILTSQDTSSFLLNRLGSFRISCFFLFPRIRFNYPIVVGDNIQMTTVVWLIERDRGGSLSLREKVTLRHERPTIL